MLAEFRDLALSLYKSRLIVSLHMLIFRLSGLLVLSIPGPCHFCPS